MAYCAGDLREHMDVLGKTNSADARGFPVETWAPVHEGVACMVTDVSGKDFYAAYAAGGRARAGIFPERAGKVAAFLRAGIFAGNAAERTFRPAHTQQTVCAAQADRAGIQGDHAADARIIGRGMAGAFKNIRELEICRALFDGAAVIADDRGKAPDLGCKFGFYLQVADDRARLRLGKQGGIAAGGREHPKLADRVILSVEGAGKTVLRARHGLERNQLRADHADVTFELR